MDTSFELCKSLQALTLGQPTGFESYQSAFDIEQGVQQKTSMLKEMGKKLLGGSLQLQSDNEGVLEARQLFFLELERISAYSEELPSCLYLAVMLDPHFSIANWIENFLRNDFASFQVYDLIQNLILLKKEHDCPFSSQVNTL